MTSLRPGGTRAQESVLLAWLVLGPMLMLVPLWRAPTSAGEDDMVYYFPLRVLTGQALRAGDLSAWNPYEQCGVPLLADPQSAAGYPPTWLFAAVGPGWAAAGELYKLAYSLNIFIAFAMAGLGAYAYLRKIGLALPAVAVGATAFQYCGFMVGHRVHLGLIATAAILGFGLWAVETLRDRPRRALVLLPGIVYLAMSAGHWPTFLNLLLIWGAYLAVRGRPLMRSAAAAGLGAAVAMLLLGGQVLSAFDLLGQTTRQRIGLATFGENSFFPINAVLAFFPLLMGGRTENGFITQPWWGAWHLCETLGYVGLTTLMLAGAGVWRLWRRGSGGELSGLVKLWAVLAAAGGVWMLGYYLPSYWLIHKIPVLNIVRAPARMVLLVDFALAALAAMAVHALLASDWPDRARLARTARRMAAIYVPAVMVGSLAVLAGLNWAGERKFGDWYPHPMAGGPGEVWQALRPTNTAIWVPLVVAAASAWAVLRFAHLGRRGVLVLLVVLVADLGIVARSVDVPARLGKNDPTISDAAELLKLHAGDEPFRVLHLTEAYFSRPGESLAPKASAVFGVENLAGYGPFQYAEHAHLFGLRIFGYSRDWEWLVRRNYLLSLYNVRYLVAEEKFAGVVESVVIPPPGMFEDDGENLLRPIGQWLGGREQVEIIEAGGEAEAVLTSDAFWRAAKVWEGNLGPLEDGAFYRIELEAKAPQGASNALFASLWEDWDDRAMIVHPEQIGRSWRRHAWTFKYKGGGEPVLRLLTYSETPIEVRKVALRRVWRDRPVNLGGKLEVGERVYEKIGELASRETLGEVVHVYENRLWLPRRFEVSRVHWFEDAEILIEELRWRGDKYDLSRESLAVGSGEAEFTGEFISERPRYRRNKVSANGLGYLKEAGDVEEAEGLPIGWFLAAAGAAGWVLLWSVRGFGRKPAV